MQNLVYEWVDFFQNLAKFEPNWLYKMQNLVYEWVDFSKFDQIWAKLAQIFKRRFWKKMVILFKIWPKNWTDWYMDGLLFLENWYLYGSTFEFRGGTSLPKPNLSTPRE